MNLLGRLRRALAIKPDEGAKSPAAEPAPLFDREHQLERALSLHEAGDLQGASEIYEQMLARNPRDADALHLTGLVAHQSGQHTRAIGLISRAIEERPAAPRFHFNLGNALAALGQSRAAAAEFRRATELDPSHAAGWFNLGSASSGLGDYGTACAALRRAFELAPGMRGLRHALAQVLANAAATGLLPATSHAEITRLLQDHWQEAPDAIEARLLLAHSLQEDRKWSEAAQHYAALLESQPDFEVAHNRLANCYNVLGRMREAIVQYHEVLRLSPGNALAASAIVSCMNYDCDATPAQMLAAHTGWAQRFALSRTQSQAHPNSRDNNRRLRLGYVSPDLRRHPVSTLFAPLIERHDRERFEIVCYYNHPGADAVTKRIRAASDRWVDVHKWNDEQLANCIRHDEIDILVDLAGHTSYGRLRAYAGKPAPVQVSWLGYFNTTGLAQMDAFITDPYSSPPGQDAWFSEKLVRLPDTRFTFEAHEFYPLPGAPRQRKNGAVTFGCLNNLAKLNDRVLATWSRILAQLPGSSLLLQAQALEDAPNRDAFLARCEHAGIARSSIEVRRWSAAEESARTYHDIDIALDPFPFCGGMTSFDALWMGTPVVTLAAELVAGRQTAAMLANLGLSDLIATDADSYVALAVALALDGARLDHLRTTLRDTFAASPLCDHQKFTSALESAYQALWRQWLAKTH